MNPYFLLKVTSPFGERISPINGKSEFHRGIDFRPMNLETYAGISGTINKAQIGELEGYYIQIQKRIKEVIFYANAFHNAKLLKSPGDRVVPTDIVAVSGTTGNSTGVHIHYEIFTYQLINSLIKDIKTRVKWFFDGQRIFFDPLEFIKYLEEKHLD